MDEKKCRSGEHADCYLNADITQDHGMKNCRSLRAIAAPREKWGKVQHWRKCDCRIIRDHVFGFGKGYCCNRCK